jgi:mannose-6-phosphate isomerase-like protein (cupin superfamily)
VSHVLRYHISPERDVTQSSPAYLRLHNRHSGEVLELLRRHINGAPILELRGSLPPHRLGPPLHIHHDEDETGTVLAGTLSVELGGQRITATAGQSLDLPRGVPHRWWNEGDTLLEFEGAVTPVVDLDRYLQALFEVINAGPPNRPPLFYVVHVILRHRHTQSALFMQPWLQLVVFSVIRAIGTLLGKYRGTDWPGCPARCPGAPRAVESPRERVRSAR